MDVDRILKGAPWNYQQVLLLLHELQLNENPKEVDLTKIDMWFQVHNLLSGYVSEKYAIDFGNHVGSFIASDPKNYTRTQREYMRIRARMDVRKPLKRKLQVKKPKSQWEWVDLKYERLNMFYYFCGISGRTNRFCHLLYDMPNFTGDKFLWGPWLKAETRWVSQIGA